jgi:cytoskeleton protein RodZ
MASFGENLRREREMRGVTLQEISAATKISVRFLQALENEDFEQLPGGIFTRGFIRAYAKYLGLDEEPTLAEYLQVVPAKTDLDLARLAVTRPGEKRGGPQGPVVVLILAVVLVAGGYALYRYSRMASEASVPAAPSPPAVQAAPEAAGIVAEAGTTPGAESPGAGTLPETPADTAAAGLMTTPANALPQPEEGLVLQVAATERAWVAVDADRKTALQRVLTPGEIETIKAKESFDLTTGNALGIVLTLNGETLKPLGRRGEVKSVHLTRNDIKKTLP